MGLHRFRVRYAQYTARNSDLGSCRKRRGHLGRCSPVDRHEAGNQLRSGQKAARCRHNLRHPLPRVHKVTLEVRVFRGWLVSFPDLRGTWQGELETTWKDPRTGKIPGPIAVILVIKQSFGAIKCAMYTRESESYSTAA